MNSLPVYIVSYREKQREVVTPESAVSEAGRMMCLTSETKRRLLAELKEGKPVVCATYGFETVYIERKGDR